MTAPEWLVDAIEATYRCGPGQVHEGYGAECESVAHDRSLYFEKCAHAYDLAEVLAAELRERLHSDEMREVVQTEKDGWVFGYGAPEILYEIDDELLGSEG